MSEIEIANGYIPGSIGRVVEMHGSYYYQNWDFGVFFESKIARELAEFIDRYDENRDGFWNAILNNRIEGSITIDGIDAESNGAHLRWFIMSDVLRGKGTGGKLMEKAVTFCQQKRYPKIYLWTFRGLNAARHLYEKFGFTLISEHEDEGWGTKVYAQKFELLL